MRDKGLEALSKVLLNQKNVKILEKEIFKNYPEENDYLRAVYQCTNDIFLKVKLTDILQNIREQRYGFNHPSFDKIKIIKQEEEDYLENPIEVVEGVLECFKCKSKKVFSFSKQVRSADEPMSTFATCISCGNKWVYSG